VSIRTESKVIRMRIASDPKQICVVRAAAEAFASREGFTGQQVGQIGLALNEALANVIEHGYEGSTEQRIDVSMEMVVLDARRALRLVVRDFGRQVDPSAIKGRDLDDVRPGGLGVHLIRAAMAQVTYRRHEQGGMEMTMVKFLDEGQGSES